MSNLQTNNSVERFSNRVESYVKYRPHYPKEITGFLNKECGFDNTKIVADIGSGPGISCENFIENGNTVYAVEPNDEMRKAAEEIFRDSENFISINGTAEATTLENNSADLIIAGQAFHWFDKEKCRIEFKRILKEDGNVVLMWNDKISSNDFMRDYYELIKKFGKDYDKINHTNVDDQVIGKFFSPLEFKKKSIRHVHPLDYAGLEGRLLSSSYIPLEGDSFEIMIKELKDMFVKYSENDKVEMEYQTNLYYGKMK
ncbi:MAG TPA: class I SAM-dependent methyltransferase [Ignavibacteria bacterium]|nr:class I SAM-dependent methyltransferase [Ignavibacteria bacterium]HMR40899.1 class I SAM-dependent methyltransferase [Ignavibacteria bacterium]